MNSSDNMPSYELNKSDFNEAGEISLLDILVKTAIAPSKGQARILVNQGGITLNDIKMSDDKYSLKEKDFNSELILKKGKKTYIKLLLK
ncbi:Tyrosine--tRNA ligase [compost metagenome]